MEQFLLIFVQVLKRFASIFFAFAILLSSGLVQFAVHICPERGLLLSSSECTMHTEVKKVPDCCQTKHAKPVKNDDCCAENYFFAVSPKFGQVGIEKLNTDIPFLSMDFDVVPNTTVSVDPSLQIHYRQSKPPLFNRDLLLSKQTFLI